MAPSFSQMARPRNNKNSREEPPRLPPTPSSSSSSLNFPSSSSHGVNSLGNHSGTFSSFLDSTFSSSSHSNSSTSKASSITSTSSPSKYLEKKDISFEEQTLGGFTLIFQDPNMELKWQSSHLLRQTRLTQRLLFISALYQGLFYWSDLIDCEEFSSHQHWQSYFFLFSSMRLFIGVLFILASFCVAMGVLSPKQRTLCFFQLIYGCPTLAIYYFTRTKNSQWDYLFLVYGLCFFALPKISPLNFIYAFYGVAFFTVMFIYISSFKLTFSEWFLSTFYLLMIVVLFLYISYSSEKSARERWLLRERLHREHIDLKIVVSSIEDDMKKAVELRSNRQYLREKDRTTSRSKYLKETNESLNISSIAAREMGSVGADNERRRNLSLILFFKGLGAWGLVMLTGYAFDTFNNNPMASLSNSAPFALLLHSTGFSIFLLYFTGQIRWFILNGVVGLAMVSILHHSGLNNRWVVISTHSIGYILLAVVCVVMFLVFGGVVLVWSRLIEFLRDIVLRYPQVKDELREEKLLEQVLVRYLSSSSFDSRKTHVDEESGESTTFSLLSSPSQSQSDIQFESRNENENKPSSDYKVGESMLAQVISPSTSTYPTSHCYFCHKLHPPYLLPVCHGWLPHDKSSTSYESKPSSSGGISLCTPYTQVVKSRDDLKEELEVKLQEIKRLQLNYDSLVHEIVEKDRLIEKEKSEKKALQDRLEKEEKEWNDRMKREKEKRSEDITRIIGEHNKQLSEVKRLYREKSKNCGNKCGDDVEVERSKHEKVESSALEKVVPEQKKDRRDIKTLVPQQLQQQHTDSPSSLKTKKSESTSINKTSGISLYPMKSASSCSSSLLPQELSSNCTNVVDSQDQSIPKTLHENVEVVQSGSSYQDEDEHDDDLPFDVFLTSMHDIQRMLLDLESGIEKEDFKYRHHENQKDEIVQHTSTIASPGYNNSNRLPYALHLFDSST